MYLTQEEVNRVPPERLRRVLEALLGIARREASAEGYSAMLRQSDFDLLATHCAAALASDAGTGEKCPFCDSSPCEGLDECRSYTAMCHRQAQANPPTSGAAPEERDGAAGNFEVALRKYVESAIAHRWANEDDPDYAAIRGRCERYRQRVLRLHREARADERRTVAAEAMRIVRRMEAQRGAGLEEQSVAASEAPAPASGDASGETRLGDLLDHMLAEHGAAISPTEMSRDERCAHVVLRDRYKADILRLYGNHQGGLNRRG